ncbi:MAG TPA: hypothetical protein VGG75_42245 [Trebonia sp.]|jgi:hypothetical protein
MKLRTGQMLVSLVDDTTVVVVRAAAGETDITCGGVSMADSKQAAGAARQTPDSGQLDGTLLGKRYADDDLGLELLVTKPGTGTLAVDGKPLPVKGARPLPASD